MRVRFILAASLAFVLMACAPKHDWRVVFNQEHGWQATFPAKPVQFSREVVLPGTSRSMQLTLSSAKVDEAMFAVGWVAKGDESTRKALESAMLANINADHTSIVRSTAAVSGLAATSVRASGEMRIQAGHGFVPVYLIMRSLTVREPEPMVIEIIAVGPKADLPLEIAEQFVESLKLVR
jgi:hypothetical protein